MGVSQCVDCIGVSGDLLCGWSHCVGVSQCVGGLTVWV